MNCKAPRTAPRATCTTTASTRIALIALRMAARQCGDSCTTTTIACTAPTSRVPCTRSPSRKVRRGVLPLSLAAELALRSMAPSKPVIWE